jgi:hypothetical protein
MLAGFDSNRACAEPLGPRRQGRSSSHALDRAKPAYTAVGTSRKRCLMRHADSGEYLQAPVVYAGPDNHFAGFRTRVSRLATARGTPAWHTRHDCRAVGLEQKALPPIALKRSSEQERTDADRELEWQVIPHGPTSTGWRLPLPRQPRALLHPDGGWGGGDAGIERVAGRRAPALRASGAPPYVNSKGASFHRCKSGVSGRTGGVFCTKVIGLTGCRVEHTRRSLSWPTSDVLHCIS